MNHRNFSLARRLGLVCLIALAAGMTLGLSAPAKRSVASLRLIGQKVLARHGDFGGTVVGGLSGIDYDAVGNRYVLVSDDRTSTDSASAPRMYFANLNFDQTSFSGMQFLSTFAMKQPDGSVYSKVPDAKVADPESVRFNPVSGNLVWVSEGDRALTYTPGRVINPFVREITASGAHVREYMLPAMFQMSAQDTGPRGNLVFEGFTFTPDRSKVVVIAEGPLFQDGALPSTSSGAVSCITVFDRASGIASAQYAYPIDRVETRPSRRPSSRSTARLKSWLSPTASSWC